MTPRRRRTAWVALVAGASWLVPAATARGTECVVKEFFAQASHQSTPRIVPPMRVVESGGAPPIIAGAMPQPRGPERVETAAEQQARAISAAINRRDLAALKAALPADAASRRDVLRERYALDNAFGASALPIVRQILQWDPAAMSARPARESNGTLQRVARNWQSLDARSRRGGLVENPPGKGDHAVLIRMLLDAGANPDGSGFDWLTPLGAIASIEPTEETTAAAELLLARGATIDKPAGVSGAAAALAMAASKQNVPLVRAMLRARRASQDALDEALVKTPIVEANGALALLLESGADINVDGKKYGASIFRPAWTASGRVKFSGERELMRLMLRYKADPNAVVNQTDSPLMNVIHDPELVRGLLELGANANYRNYAGDAPIHLALRIPTEVQKAADDNRPLTTIAPALDPRVREASVKLLLQHGADPNARDSAGATPLMLTTGDDAAVIDALIARGGKVELDDKALAYYRQYKVPLGPVSWALVRRNDPLAAALLARQGALTGDDCGAVFYAAQTGAVRTLAALLDRKADVRAASGEHGVTPLIIAARAGEVGAVRLLLERRAANVDEMTPKMVVTAGGHGWAVPVLIGGQTALMAASAAGRKAVVEALIARGADISRADLTGFTALGYARAAHAEDIVALLQARGAHE